MLKVCESICHTHLDYDSSNLCIISKNEHSYNAINNALFHDISVVYLLRKVVCFVLISSAFEWSLVSYSKIYHGINTIEFTIRYLGYQGNRCISDLSQSHI